MHFWQFPVVAFSSEPAAQTFGTVYALQSAVEQISHFCEVWFHFDPLLHYSHAKLSAFQTGFVGGHWAKLPETWVLLLDD